MGLMGGTALLTGFLAYGMSRGGTEAITAPGQRQILPRPRLLTANEPLRAGKTVFPDGHDGFGYNGGIPGPTIRIRRGETFTRRVENLMDQPTTVHWHGLLAPTDMDGQPHDEIAAGTVREYSFPIVQRAGLNWYHPHPHGAAAIQAWHGLAGLLVVEDDEEAALGLPSGDSELFLVLRDAQVDAGGVFGYTADIAGTQGGVPFINGAAWPRTALPRGFARLRILNGANARVFRLSSEAPLTVIGNDGGLIDTPQPVDEIEVGPAERVDVIMDLRGFTPGTKVGLTCNAAGWRVLEIRVTEAPHPDWEIPERLSEIETLSHTGEPDRTFVFQDNEKINDTVFDMKRIDFAVPFGRVERWRFVSARGAPHPVHVHGTHFQVQEGTAPDDRIRPVYPWERGWKDTVLVRTHETVDVLVRFDAYEGRYLLHCHKLEHEDHGMMMNFVVGRNPEEAMRKAELELLYGPICTSSG
ncbi:multicopper oxidase family protein [Agrobacterium tumefaciens]|uniref:multicopper oxidase family protein n=1 Tax=Agrobacterium tumefaciens TaxID=358 RepID=UPI0021CF8313|nr:multicopper oxidase domain-containing protein [Agrobacterium tumefaciens]NTZ63468.1 multicopper oxidase domain-containing protein [Agrobacterium tumefaciens]UXT00197.1 multicopper oxidase domain-containing protein [Agrobacterium tumefaciens]UXT52897.1 multicopper oxidase domain-containing protein [Agrobacterium tumefaciens]